MSANRCQQILKRVLQCDDANSGRRNRSKDKFQPIKDVFEEWDFNLRDPYNPGLHMTVDEQLVWFRGRCPFRQYIPSTPGKYGIKIWAICTANTSFAWKMQVYTGKNAAVGRLTKEQESSKILSKRLKTLEGTLLAITFLPACHL